MFATLLLLCAGFMLPLNESEKTVDNTPTATVQKTETPSPADKPADQTAEKPAEKSGDKTPEDKPADQTANEKSEDKTAEGKSTDKATTEKSADKSAEEKKEGKEEKKEEKKDKDEELLAIEANVISYTNNERAKYGLPPLEVDKQLMKTAREHCSWMTLNRIFQHTRRSVAENIAMGQPSSQDVVRTWMNSSGHRANILNPNHRRIGVSAYRTEGGTIYWVQQFSR